MDFCLIVLLGDTIGVGQQPPWVGGERPSSSPGEESKAADMVVSRLL